MAKSLSNKKKDAAPKKKAVVKQAVEKPAPAKAAARPGVPSPDECSGQYETAKHRIFKLKPSARKKYGGRKKIMVAK